jgi:cerevisin
MSPILSLSFFSLALAASSLATPLSTSQHYDGRKGSPLLLAPLHTVEHEAPHGLINDSYIIMFKKDLPLAALDNHYNFIQAAHAEYPHLDGDSGIRHVFDRHIKGYTGKFTDRVLQRIREMPEVDYVERDQIVKIQDVQTTAPWVRHQSAYFAVNGTHAHNHFSGSCAH